MNAIIDHFRVNFDGFMYRLTFVSLMQANYTFRAYDLGAVAAKQFKIEIRMNWTFFHGPLRFFLELFFSAHFSYVVILGPFLFLMQLTAVNA